MNHLFRSSCWLLVLSLAVNGCGGSSNQPVTATVDLSQGRKDVSVKVEDLYFPEGFPAEIELLKPVRIYQQTDPTDAITWDTFVSPKEFRDHYVEEFKKLGFEPQVVIPQGIAGECYEVQAFDQVQGQWHCVAVGQRESETQVSCFLHCRKLPDKVPSADAAAADSADQK